MISNDKKKEQLGISIGTASNILKKRVMFSLLVKLGENQCFRCGEEIKNAEEMSIDHKLPWLDNDIELFWELENIGFSHLSCNIKCRRVPNKIEYKKGEKWCWKCKSFKLISRFRPSAEYDRNRPCRGRVCTNKMQAKLREKV